ncbi:ATP-dependent RNA helicase DHX30-like isoform X2 [Anthonomus grandis grandis]|uniref:ATP-dependent RNA helicase DHX30-like isoform X2 n=1 Tax=Anthonomus grandis grandis TaxID=2921223 RepID=UPI002165B821|nr:ATP-dependent RNA helicase DHX30-like isoform X2 [Anthonomus grandis grandis]
MLSRMFIVNTRIFSQINTKISLNRRSSIHNTAMASEHEKRVKSYQERLRALKEFCDRQESKKGAEERPAPNLNKQKTVPLEHFTKLVKIPTPMRRLFNIKQHANQCLQARLLSTQNNSTLKNEDSSQRDNKELKQDDLFSSDIHIKVEDLSYTSRRGGLKKKKQNLEDNSIDKAELNKVSCQEENNSSKLQKFPFPKSVLNQYYQIVSEDLKNNSVKPITTYASNHKGQKVTWTCTYHLKWPTVAKISADHSTKKDASHTAAQKVLQLLLECGKMAPDGSPIIHTQDEIRKLQKQKRTKVELKAAEVDNMRNIINIFNDNMKHKVDSVDFVGSLDEFSKDFITEEQDCERKYKASPIFLGTAKYFAREKVSLPISAYKESFIQLLQNNNCVIVKGQPGCGKSSRVPQYVLESWIRQAQSGEEFCRIAVTQPRRIAAISLSERVASERTEEVGHIVGYQVRLKSKFQDKTGRVLYCTTGILLRHLQADPRLLRFSHVILDEAHERDVNTDLLMNLIRRALQQNSNLKLVVMSATIDTEAFSEYFNGAPIFSIPGFTHPVGVYYLDDLYCPKTLNMCNQEHPQVIHEEVVEVIKSIHREKPEGAILVFLPGWEDLSRVQRLLNAKSDMVVHLVHSKLKDSEQHNIFSRPPPGIRKVILATNIAETSITIDDVVYVVDSGIHKNKIFDVDKGIDVIDLKWISKASADQRAGRAGRCSPGEAVRLYSRKKYEELEDYTVPEILNSSLTKIVLDSKVYSSNMNACEFMETLITPPERTAVEKAVEELKELELLDEQERLTPLGRTLVDFQLEPRLAKAMVNGVIFRCATPIVDIITLFSSDSNIFGSLGLLGKEMVKKHKSQFCNSSDHLAMMRMYEKWLELVEENGYHEAERFCDKYNLVSHKLNFIKKLKDIHFEYLYKGLHQSMPVSDDYSDNDELVKAVLYSGTGTVLEHRNWDIVKNRLKTGVNVLVTRNNHKATITGESVNFKRNKFPTNFLVYITETRSNIRRTTTVRECSLIPSISVLLFNNGGLEIIQPDPNNPIDENDVIIGIKNTKLRFLCKKKPPKEL